MVASDFSYPAVVVPISNGARGEVADVVWVGGGKMARYKHLSVKTVDLADFAGKTKERQPTARQLAQRERDDEIRAALNEAAALPASQAIVIELKEGQKLPTMRAAVNRLLKADPRELNWGVRGTSLVITKGTIPGRRGPR